MDRDDAILEYLQDRLPPEDRLAFEASMAQDADLAAEVEVMRAVRTEMASGAVHENAQAVWDKLSTAMDTAQNAATDQARHHAPTAANENRPPWVQALRYAAVAVVAIAAWQVAVVPRLGDAGDRFRTASDQVSEVALQVKFTPVATLAEIGALLGPLGGTISDGPGALGVVQVSFVDAEQRDAARAVLEARRDLVELLIDPEGQ